jgi:tRNA pseudouridine-54 N-methylase
VNQTQALADVLATEHQAIYAYGVLGARLDPLTRAQALAAFDAHRVRRDVLLARLRSLQLPTPGPAASYDLLVSTQAQAVALAVRVETEVGIRWRDLVGSTDDRALRQLAVQALQDTAVRAAGWRVKAGLTPASVALPGV